MSAGLLSSILGKVYDTGRSNNKPLINIDVKEQVGNRWCFQLPSTPESSHLYVCPVSICVK